MTQQQGNGDLVKMGGGGRLRKISLRWIAFVFILVFLFFGYKGTRLAVGIWRWDTLSWAPHYLMTGPSKETVPDSEKHLIFIMVDHYEHGSKPTAVEKNKIWCDKFRAISDRYRDDYGNKFRYTWFYPFDHHVGEIMHELSDMALEGYGEVEFHWHMPTDGSITPQSYSEKLADALRWFHQFGAMVTEEEEPKTVFAYVAGNWDLDASRKPVSNGLVNQIEVLHQNGCYADFTFSTLGTAAQPRKINSIYYVVDDIEKSKSHDTGIDAVVGKQPTKEQFMIFEGPSIIDWNGSLEYGAMEADPRFSPKRISKWIEANIHIKGRPEWVFVKVFSHGAQSSKIILDHDMEIMLQSLQSYCKERGIKLHFMTTREAYNVVKAAEDNKTGNPEDFRDYYIPKYQNMVRSFRPDQK